METLTRWGFLRSTSSTAFALRCASFAIPDAVRYRHFEFSSACRTFIIAPLGLALGLILIVHPIVVADVMYKAIPAL